MPLSTVEAIRDRIYSVLEGLTPTSLTKDKFRRFRNEGGARFVDAMEKNPTGALRRVQVREDSDEGTPEISNTTEERIRVRYHITVAYPQTERYGKEAAMDRDDVMYEDWKKIKHAIGIDGRGNFSTGTDGSYDAVPLGITKSRDEGSAVDFQVMTAEFEFVRSTT
jgi:hypothetical protein